MNPNTARKVYESGEPLAMGQLKKLHEEMMKGENTVNLVPLMNTPPHTARQFQLVNRGAW